MFQLDNHIPPPSGLRHEEARKYPFGKMEVGQSFLVSFSGGERARVAAAKWKSRHPGWDYQTRVETPFSTSQKSLRIWRTS